MSQQTRGHEGRIAEPGSDHRLGGAGKPHLVTPSLWRGRRRALSGEFGPQASRQLQDSRVTPGLPGRLPFDQAWPT